MSAISLKGKIRLPRPGPLRGAEPVDAPLPLMKHLEELRDRLIKCAIGVIAATVVAFLFIDKIMGVLIDLAGTHTVQAIDPTETFGAYLQLALMTGVGLAIPLLVYQILRFLSPGLTKIERRWLFISLPFVALAFASGAAFCYYVVLPSALNFLLSFGDPRILKQVSLTKFVSFVSSFILAVGASFEMPIVVFLLAKLHVVTYKQLAKWRKYALLVSFVVAAVITPTPDPVNQSLVGIPMFLLYELGVQLSRFARKKQA